MPSTGSANHWTVRQNGGNIEIVDAANVVKFSKSADAFNHLVINTSGAFNDSLTVDFSYGGSFNIGYGINFNGNTNRNESFFILGSNDDDIWQINVEGRYYGGLPIYLSSVEQVTINGQDGKDQIWMEGSTGSDTFRFTRGIAEFSTGTTQFETVNVEEVFVDAQAGNDTAKVIGTEYNNTFTLRDNFFVMTGGGYRLELKNL